ncbi:MAG: hypothetical protein RLZZ44_1452, partial [Bacteroidota bacterium]
QGFLTIDEEKMDLSIVQVVTKSGSTIFEVYEKIGAVFPNTKKRDGKDDPDMSGTIVFDGTEWNVSGWKRISNKTGQEFTSLAAREKKQYDDNSNQSQYQKNGASGDILDDEMPF